MAMWGSVVTLRGEGGWNPEPAPAYGRRGGYSRPVHSSSASPTAGWARTPVADVSWPMMLRRYVWANGICAWSTMPGESTGEEYAIAINQGNTKLKDDINQAIKDLTDDGTVDALMAKYNIK